MKRTRILALSVLSALCLFAANSDSNGQKLGGLAGGGGAGARAAAGGARGGAAVGPFGGAGAGARATANVLGPGGKQSAIGAVGGFHTTKRGTTIDYAGVGGKTMGPGGVTTGGAAGGVKITGPNGREVTKVGAVGGAVGPNGNGIAKGGSATVAKGPNGAAASINRGGIAVGPNGAVAGKARIGAATGPGGTVIGGSRAGVAVGPNGLAAYRSGVATTGHRTNYVAAGAIRTQGIYVRKSFVHYNAFRPNWYVAHPHAWRAAAWTAAVFWRGAAWATVSLRCGYPPAPIIYDYGTTIVYTGDTVYYQGEPIATAEQYTEQAAAIAAQGQAANPSEKEDWISLGVFGMVKGEETEANQIFQLAVNKDGVIRGNYYDALSDSTLPVFGSVDKKTQRAAWTVGDRKETVYETGVGNLTEDETTMLVHFGKDRTQQWTLIRLEEQPE